MSWLRRAEPDNPHECAPPLYIREVWPPSSECGPGSPAQLRLPGTGAKLIRPDGKVGDLWECDTCHQVWLIRGTARHKYTEWQTVGRPKKTRVRSIS